MRSIWNSLRLTLTIPVLLTLPATHAPAQTKPSTTAKSPAAAESGAIYDALIRQSADLLKSGDAAQALTLSQTSIKADPKRWEAYDLAGQALTSLHRYDEAIAQFSQANVRATASQQATISAHLKQCILAQAGDPAPPAPAPAKTATAKTATASKSAPAPTLGVIGVQFLNGASSASGGATISGVTPNGPTANAGLMPQDIIVSMDGAAIASGAALSARLTAAHAGQTIQLGYLRDGQQGSIEVTAVDSASVYPPQPATASTARPPADLTKLDVATLIQQANAGNEDAQWELGNRYFNGTNGVAKDYTQASLWINKAAAQGLVVAMYGVGLMFDQGVGSPRDLGQAIPWYQSAADLGYVPAEITLGNVYASGSGVPKDNARALALFSAAAARGAAVAQFRLGDIYLNGKGVPIDYSQAFNWFTKAANQGYSMAETSLGYLYDKGFGAAQNPQLAAQWYLKAADQGYSQAEYDIGSCYLTGSGVVQDTNQARLWFQKAAGQGLANARNSVASILAKLDLTTLTQLANAGDVAAEEALGTRYGTATGVAKDFTQAMSWYQKSAALGNSTAQKNLGILYLNGWGTPVDHAQALSWFQKAAAQGNDLAEENLALMYENATGVPQDYPLAMSWFQKSAAQGNAESQNNIGSMYQKGWGTTQNLPQAVSWYQKAAAQGNATAEKNLAQMYENGWGTAVDDAQALSWYQKAAAQGDQSAQQAVARLTAPPAQAATPIQVASNNPDPARQAQIADLIARINALESDADTDATNSVGTSAIGAMAGSAFGGLFGAGAKAVSTKNADDAAKEKAEAAQLRQQLIALQGSDAGAAPQGPSFTGMAVSAIASMATANAADPNLSVAQGVGAGVAGTIYYAAGAPDPATAGLQTGIVTPAATLGAGAGSGGSNTSTAAANACNQQSQNSPEMTACRQSPGLQQYSCYKAAANLCQCYMTAYGQTNPDYAKWQTCRDQNNASAASLNSTAPTIGR